MVCLLPALLIFTLPMLPAYGQDIDSVTVTETSPPDTLILGLYRSVQLALDQSPQAWYAENTVQQSWFSLKSARYDLYSPEIGIDLNTPSYRQALNEQLIFDPEAGQVVRRWITTENRRWAADLNMQQPLPTGGYVMLTSTVYRRFYASDITGEEDELEYRSSYRLSFQQELLRGNIMRVAKKRAELAFESAMLSDVETRRNLVYNVIQAYYQLLSNRREVEINRDDLDASRETASLARRKYEAGLTPEVEAMQLEVEAARAEMDVLSADAQHEILLDEFRDLLGLPLNTPLRLVGEPEFDTVEVNLEDAIARALDQREAAKMAELDVEQADLAMKDARRPYRIGTQVTGFYDLDLRDSELDKAFSADYDDYSVNRGFGLNVSIPLFSGGRRNVAIQQAELSRRRANYDAEQQEKQIVLEVRSAVNALKETRRRYEISMSSLEIAERSYEISQQRFANGQITAREWIDAQIALNRSRISVTRALIDHELAQARFRMVTGDPILPGIRITASSEDFDQ